MTRKNGFTLIELVGVLVIMTIIALIATPLIMNIIRSARVSADKRSIDAYARSIELAIASYLLDNGKFPTIIGELTIEYNGNEVVCSTTQLNNDSSVYLAGCRVAGRTVDYAYGTDKTPSYTAYSIGDHVSYNGITYYVIEDSGTTNDTVKLLKETPLTKTEMDNLNLTGITISEENGYGRVQYGSSADYSTSTVKQVVDAWKNTAVKSGDRLKVRLLLFSEVHNLGYSDEEIDLCGGCGSVGYIKTDSIPNWLYINSGYDGYWIISRDDLSYVWNVRVDGNLLTKEISLQGLVRPVLELNKTADITKLQS